MGRARHFSKSQGLYIGRKIYIYIYIYIYDDSHLASLFQVPQPIWGKRNSEFFQVPGPLHRAKVIHDDSHLASLSSSQSQSHILLSVSTHFFIFPAYFSHMSTYFPYFQIKVVSWKDVIGQMGRSLSARIEEYKVPFNSSKFHEPVMADYCNSYGHDIESISAKLLHSSNKSGRLNRLEEIETKC